MESGTAVLRLRVQEKFWNDIDDSRRGFRPYLAEFYHILRVQLIAVRAVVVYEDTFVIPYLFVFHCAMKNDRT